MTQPVRVVAVVGPTASGKTTVGIELANRIRGEIISVDSIQVYRWMDIGAAKPSAEMRRVVPHHLIDILNPDEAYNAGKFAIDADAIIQKLTQKGKTAILLGGTNLYLKALVNGIIPIPAISKQVKAAIQDLHKFDGVEGCYRELKKLDPKSAGKLHPNDVSRITRALEVVMETGTSIQDFQQNHGFREKRYKVLSIGIRWPREALYQRIDSRVLEMVEAGLVDEAKELLKQGYRPDLQPLKSIGYRQTFQFLDGKISKEEMIADIQQKSRQYAKKQMTWLNKESNIIWLDGGRLTEEVFDAIEAFLKTGDSPK